jgi:hypothetical protein
VRDRGEDARAEKLSALAGLDAALTDPIALVRVLQEATDDEDAVRRVAGAFGLTPDQATAVLDQQLMQLTPARRQRLAGEVRTLRSEWGPPIEGELRFTTRRSAVLTLDGTERRFTAGGVGGVLDLLFQHLLEDIARPALRPVVATVTGLPDGPTRMTVTPSGDGHVDQPG